MKRVIKWQDVALVALRAALLAVLTLLGDRLAGGRPSDLLVRALAVPVPAAQRLVRDDWSSKSSSLVPFVPASLSLSGRRLHPRLG